MPVTIAAVTGTRPHEAGLASGLINTTQQIGGALGVAILVSISSSKMAGFGPGAQVNPEALTSGYSQAFFVGACFALAAAILASLMISSKDSREQAEAAKRGEAAPVAV